MIEFVELPVGDGSSVGCTRCGAERRAPVFRSRGEIVADVRRAVDMWSAPPGPNVMLGGAEPFAHPELPAIVAGAIDAGVARLGLDTDAIALQSAGNAAGSIAAGVRHLRVTLLGGSPGMHDALAGAPGRLDALLAGLGTFLAAASAEGTTVSVTAVVPLCAHNVHDAPAAAGLAVEVGCDRVLLRLVDGEVSLPDAARWIAAACDTGVVNGVWVEVEGLPYCVFPGYDLHLSDVVRARTGAKPATCADCPLDAMCGGAPPGASGDVLADLAAPDFASRLARSVARVRSSGTSR